MRIASLLFENVVLVFCFIKKQNPSHPTRSLKVLSPVHTMFNVILCGVALHSYDRKMKELLPRIPTDE